MKPNVIILFVIPLMVFSFLCGIIATKDIPMDGYPETPSNTYLVASNVAQRFVNMLRPKKDDKNSSSFGTTAIYLTNTGTSISWTALTNGYTYTNVIIVWSSTNISWWTNYSY